MQSRIRSGVLGVGVALAWVASAAPAEAQVSAYGVAGPAGLTGFYRTSAANAHLAGGVEAVVGGRVGGQGEFGALGGEGGLLFVTSGNGLVRLGTRNGRVSPFVTGGYSRLSSGDGGFDAWNAGAGADIWLKPRVGLRLDVRDHVRPDSRGTVHYWTVRAGVSFR